MALTLLRKWEIILQPISYHNVLSEGCKYIDRVFAFTHYDMFLAWDLGIDTHFFMCLCGISLDLTSRYLFCADEKENGFLITDRFQLVFLLFMTFSTSFSPHVQNYFPVSFHIIRHNFISEYVFRFLPMYGLGIHQHLVKIHTSSTFKKCVYCNADTFNTCFTHCKLTKELAELHKMTSNIKTKNNTI